MLIVDDNATNRRILEEMLASWHMKPVAVADASAALNVLRYPTGDRFHAVITDGHMPGTDGFTLARRIKDDRTLKTMPVIMLTSVGHPDMGLANFPCVGFTGRCASRVT